MSALTEVKRAYTESTRKLNFLASTSVSATSLATVLKTIGRYNNFSPARVAKVIRSVDPKARVRVGREGSPVLYIKTTEAKTLPMAKALKGAAVDELHKWKNISPATRRKLGVGNWIRAWWD